MPCNYDYVRELKIEMNNIILMNQEGAEMLQNILRATGMPRAEVTYEPNARPKPYGRIYIREAAGALAGCAIEAEQVVADSWQKEMFDLVKNTLPRLQVIKLQLDIVAEFEAQGIEVEQEWFPDGRLELTV